MKINYTPQVMRAVKNYKKQAGKTESARPKQMASDKLEISSSAKQFQVAFAAVKNMPELREARVSELKERVQNGTYHVPTGDIVDSLFK